ncbi:DUF5994 family protein [Streptomyces sp. Ag109_O5-10]|uniref:DUF5994 family protein n=1 Tax=Streptomyces sp. Ag109_O5-10 TaxID=1855349 RepID=UPI0035245A9E
MLRLELAPAGTTPALIGGAWWPRFRDLKAELPALIEVLDPLWMTTSQSVSPIHAHDGMAHDRQVVPHGNLRT